MTNRKIRWDAAALYYFNKAIEYIALDSVQNAEKVRLEILEKIGKLSDHPEMHAPDKYKQENDKNYRAFELYHYRISYYVSVNEIRILRVRHTSQEPKNY